MSHRYLTASLLLPVALFGCVISKFVLPAPTPPPAGGCVYRNVWVEPDNNRFVLSYTVESLRRRALLRAAETLHSYQLWRVENREHAYWRLYSHAWSDTNGKPNVRIGIGAELKLARHVFLVMLDDPSFPYRGDLGRGSLIVNASYGQLNSDVDYVMQGITQADSEQLQALCVARERLIREGLSEVEDLRAQLVEEIQRLRRRRATEQNKSLSITVERGAEPQGD